MRYCKSHRRRRGELQHCESARGFLKQRLEDLKERAERAERKEDHLHALLVDLRPQPPAVEVAQ